MQAWYCLLRKETAIDACDVEAGRLAAKPALAHDGVINI